LSSYKVTFISDYFVLSTTVDSSVYDDEEILDTADQCMIDWCGFAPKQFSFDYDIEEVSYA